jgi:hypothetical protein
MMGGRESRVVNRESGSTFCADEQYLPIEKISCLKKEDWRLRQLIDGYIRYLRAQIRSKQLSVREEPLEYGEGLGIEHDSRISM